jgi:hypothetical protein
LKKRARIEGPFAPRTIAMLKSPGMRALSLAARRALDRIEIELAQHGGKDNGGLPVTFADFRRFGIHLDAIAPALRELLALGFITIKPGRGGNTSHRAPSRYGLTYRPTAGAGPTDDWQHVHTVEQADVIAAAARKASAKRGIMFRSPLPKSGSEATPEKRERNPLPKSGSKGGVFPLPKSGSTI